MVVGGWVVVVVFSDVTSTEPAIMVYVVPLLFHPYVSFVYSVMGSASVSG